MKKTYWFILILFFVSLDLKAASVYTPFVRGDLIDANSLNVRFTEIKNKLSAKLINVSLVPVAEVIKEIHPDLFRRQVE